MSSKFGRGARAVVVSALLAAAIPVQATVGFSYAWKSPRVTVTWREGNFSSLDPGLRRQVGHWTRVAQSMWAQAKGAPPVEIQVSFHGPEMASNGPVMLLACGNQRVTIPAPLTESRVTDGFAKLLSMVTSPSSSRQSQSQQSSSQEIKVPADDAEPRISPDGQWIAGITWRGGAPEVWVMSRDGRQVLRAEAADADNPLSTAIVVEPRWSADGRWVAWVQGGRLAKFQPQSGKASFVTPKDRSVTSFSWSPTEPRLAVAYDDSRFELVDVAEGWSVPASDLVGQANLTSDLYWSPSGKRLLFRIQGTVEAVNFSSARGRANAWQRFVDGVTGGEKETQKVSEGGSADRLAVLDLPARSLHAYPLAGSPALALGTLKGVAWSADEDWAYVVVSGVSNSGAPEPLVLGVALSSGLRSEKEITGPQPIIALGARELRPESANDGAGGRYFAFLQGERLVLMHPDLPYPGLSLPQNGTRIVTLQAGPSGNYQGVEDDLLTENEVPVRLLLEDSEHYQGGPVRVRVDELLAVALPGDSPLREALLRLGRDTVDVDVLPQSQAPFAVTMSSTEGGAAKWIALQTIDGKVERLSLSQLLSTAEPQVAPLQDGDFRLLDAHTGMDRLSGAGSKTGPRWEPLLVLAGLGALAFVLIRRRRRRDTP